jgi:hypothetical protein
VDKPASRTTVAARPKNRFSEMNELTESDFMDGKAGGPSQAFLSLVRQDMF